MNKQDKQNAIVAGKAAVGRLVLADNALVSAYFALGQAYAPVESEITQAEYAGLIGTSQTYVSRGQKLAKAFRTEAAAIKAYNAQDLGSVSAWITFLGSDKKATAKKPVNKNVTEKQAAQRAMNASYFVHLPKEAQRIIIAAAK